MITANFENLISRLEKMPINILNHKKLYQALNSPISKKLYFSANDLAKHWHKFLKTDRSDILKLVYYLPYCAQKCSYCREPSRKIKNANEVADYVQDSIKEIDFFSKVFKNRKFSYISINGGSPDILSLNDLKIVLEAITTKFNFYEKSARRIELNPTGVSRKKLEIIKSFGINEVSFGVQSLTERVLVNAGRPYVSYELLKKIIKLAREVGFSDINVDLILGLPGENYVQFEKNLRKICKLELSQIIVYILNEPNDKYLNKYLREDTSAFYKRIEQMLADFLNSQLLNDIEKLNYKLIPLKENVNYNYFTFIKKNALEFDWFNNKRDRYINISSLGIGKQNVSNIFNDILYKRSLDFNKEERAYEGFGIDWDYEMRKFVFYSVESTQKINTSLFKKIFKKNIHDVFGYSINVLKNNNRIKIKNDNILFINNGSKDILIDLTLFVAGKRRKK